MPYRLHAFLLCVLLASVPGSAAGQEGPTAYVGAVAGVATLSGDARAVISPEGFASSSYDHRNGPALNLLAGAHIGEYVSIQGNYIWNRNDVVLFSGDTRNGDLRFYQDSWRSSQHTVVGDLLVYFRERTSRIRPYLSGGLGVVKLNGDRIARTVGGAGLRPPADLSSTDLILRVAVGVDVPVGRGWNIRYSFSESLGANPIGERLEPAGTAILMNFQNLVGVLYRF